MIKRITLSLAVLFVIGITSCLFQACSSSPNAISPTSQQPTVAMVTTSTTTTTTTTAAITSSAPTTTTAGPLTLLADHAGYTACAICHKNGVNGAPQTPASHASYSDTSPANAALCRGCHK